MADAPVTLEGYFTLHAMYGVDWPRWNALGDAERAAIVSEATPVLDALMAPAEGASALFAINGLKADLCLVHFRKDLETLRRDQTAFDRCRLRAFVNPTYSYVAVIELGTYELAAHAAAVVERQGKTKGTPEYDTAVQAEMERIARPRLYPNVPEKRFLCFYPMSKRRGEQVNWYDLSGAERAGFMRGHGEIGRKYAGKVVQIIQGSVGLDDWEWGVTLFADDPLVFKKLVYEMRFDPASSRFALFGPFYIGRRITPGDVGGLLAGTAPLA